MRLLLLLLIGCVVAVPSRADDNLTTKDFSGQSLRAVLQHYAAGGIELFYSDAMLPSSVVVDINPPVGAAIERLRYVLTEAGLELKAATRDNAYLVVRSDPADSPSRIVVCGATSRAPISPVTVTTSTGLQLTTAHDGSVELPFGEAVVSLEHAEYLAWRSAQHPPRQIQDPWACSHFLLQLPAMEEIVVSSSRYSVRDFYGSRTDFDSAQLGEVAEVGGDAMRVVNRLPGVAGVGVSAKPYVRGGANDELLVLFDGVELIEPFHLKDFQSVFSGLNPSVVDSIDIYTGGFPARYGNRMSGVMDVRSKSGYQSLGAELGVSPYSTNAALSNSFADGRGSWASAFRRGNIDWVTQKVNPDVGEPSFYDGYLLADFVTPAGIEFNAGWLTYNDDVKLSSLDDGEGREAESTYKNHYTWLQAHYQIDEVTQGHTQLSVATISNSRNGYLDDPNEDEGLGRVIDRRKFNLYRFQQAFNREYSMKHALEFGVGVEYVEGRYNYELEAEFGELATVLGQPRSQSKSLQLSPEGLTANLFVSHRWRPFEGFTLESGLRWDYQDYYTANAAEQVSPRINILYQPGARIKWRLGIGRFYQPEGIYELQVEQDDPQFQTAQYSDQLIGGFEADLGRGFSLRTEAYFKRVGRPKVRYENLFNWLILLPELAPDRVEVDPVEARARGVEVTLRYQGRATSAWFSTTFSSAQDRLRGSGWTSRAWDQRTSISAGWAFRGERWSLSVGALWHSGWKTTAVPPLLTTLDEPARLALNRDELANFFSLDLRYVYRWQWQRQSLELIAELTNVTNRKNAGSVETEIEELESGEYEFFTESEDLFPLVPSIGFIWRFE